MKIFIAAILILDTFTSGLGLVHLLQLQTGTPESIPDKNTVWWVIVVALAGAITALVVYIRKSHLSALEALATNNEKTIAIAEKYSAKIEELMKGYLKDDREVIEKSNLAFDRVSISLDNFEEVLKDVASVIRGQTLDTKEIKNEVRDIKDLIKKNSHS